MALESKGHEAWGWAGKEEVPHMQRPQNTICAQMNLHSPTGRTRRVEINPSIQGDG